MNKHIKPPLPDPDTYTPQQGDRVSFLEGDGEGGIHIVVYAYHRDVWQLLQRFRQWSSFEAYMHNFLVFAWCQGHVYWPAKA